MDINYILLLQSALVLVKLNKFFIETEVYGVVMSQEKLRLSLVPFGQLQILQKRMVQPK